MAQYSWKCDECGTVTEVIRKISDIDIKPDDGCEKCKSQNLQRIIAEWKREQTQLVRGGIAPWYDETVIGKRHYPTGR